MLSPWSVIRFPSRQKRDKHAHLRLALSRFLHRTDQGLQHVWRNIGFDLQDTAAFPANLNPYRACGPRYCRRLVPRSWSLRFAALFRGDQCNRQERDDPLSLLRRELLAPLNFRRSLKISKAGSPDAYDATGTFIPRWHISSAAIASGSS
jgi:hypothetical protein